jgi:hypothetical protein
MTIHDVEMAWSRSNGGVTLSSDGKQALAKFSDGYQVTHSYDATEIEILSATGLPSFSSYKPGTFIPCTGISLEQRGLLMSLVRIDYDKSITRNDNNYDWAQNPLSAPPIIRWEDETTTEPIDQDADGEPIVTVNKEPINGVTIDLPDPVLTVTRNFATWNPHVIHQYRMSVNSDTFAGFAPGTGRLVSAGAELVIDPTYGGYWRVTARVRFRYPYNTTAEKAWYARVRHEGFQVKVGTKIEHAKTGDDNTGEKVVTPVLLKSDGTRETVAANAHWLEFKRYFPLPYVNLGLL